MVAATMMRVPYSYLDRQYRDIEPYIADIRELAKTGDFTLGYPVRQFEEMLSRRLGGQHVVGASSGTAGLILALRALGIGHGDEVIVPVNTFVASAGAVAMVGATPVFCDVDETYTIDVDDAESRITSKTKAIIAVHLTGTMADMTRLRSLSLSRCPVIEDAAQAMGATYLGLPAGELGDVAAWSMHPLKMINVWGDAGAASTKFDNLDASMRLLRNHGLRTRDDVVVFGDNLRISSLQAAIACRALERADWARDERRKNAGALSSYLADLAPSVRVPVHHDGVEPVYATYVIRVERRDMLRDFLLSRYIDVKVHYPKPLHLQTVGLSMGYDQGDFPEAERQADEILSLPMHEYLTDDEIEYMSDQVHAFYSGAHTR